MSKLPNNEVKLAELGEHIKTREKHDALINKVLGFAMAPCARCQKRGNRVQPTP